MNTFAHAAPVYPCNKVGGYYSQKAAEIMNTQACKINYSLVFKAGVEGTSWVRYIYGPAEYILLGSPSLALSLTNGGPLGLGKKILWDSVENIIKVAFRHPEKASKKVAKATYDMGLKAYRENYKLYKKHKKGEALSEDEARRFVINWYVQSYMVAAKKLYNDVTSYEKKDDFKNVPQLALQQFESLAIGSAKDSFGPLGEIEVSGLLKLTKGQFTVIESVIGQSAGLGAYPPYQRFKAKVLEIDNHLRNALGDAEEVMRTDELKRDVTESLSRDTIVRLFSKRLNEDGKSYNLEWIEWQEGSLTKGNAQEAIVSFTDDNQCYGAGRTEAWLLQFESGWKISEKIEEGYALSIEVVDIDNDGKLEIWITREVKAQGFIENISKLISIDGDSQHFLYSNSGFDYRGAMSEGEAVCEHNIEFCDLNNDGVLEITDTEVRKSFGWTGKKHASDYVEISSKRKTHVYELKGRKFVKYVR
jgi:hypothetical protein